MYHRLFLIKGFICIRQIKNGFKKKIALNIFPSVCLSANLLKEGLPKARVSTLCAGTGFSQN